jgi:hypothetical protein
MLVLRLPHLGNTQRILAPPLVTCEEYVIPLEILPPQHMFLTAPFYVFDFYQDM